MYDIAVNDSAAMAFEGEKIFKRKPFREKNNLQENK